jgi:hypothetical protein
MFRLMLVFAVAVVFIGLTTSVVAGRNSATRLESLETRAQELIDRAERLLSPPATTDGPAPRVVRDSFGLAVSLRDACTEDSLPVGAAPEGTTVYVIADGQGECAGWSLGAFTSEDGAEIEGWLESRYLGPTS